MKQHSWIFEASGPEYYSVDIESCVLDDCETNFSSESSVSNKLKKKNIGSWKTRLTEYLPLVRILGAGVFREQISSEVEPAPFAFAVDEGILVHEMNAADRLLLGQRIVNDDKLAGQRVQNDNLVVRRRRRCVTIVRAEDQLLHYSLDAGIHVSRHVARAQVPCYESIGYRDHVTVVRGQAETEDRKLMTFQGVLDGTDGKKERFQFYR